MNDGVEGILICRAWDLSGYFETLIALICSGSGYTHSLFLYFRYTLVIHIAHEK